MLPQSTMYLNDGLGTERSLRLPAFARIKKQVFPGLVWVPVSEPSPFAQPLKEIKPTVPSLPALELRLSSSSHPDPLHWYKSRDVSFEWTPIPQAEYGFVFDQTPLTMPDTSSKTKNTSTIFKNVNDGIWYFHLNAYTPHNISETAHYRVMIDTVPPEEFTVSLMRPTPALDNKYALTFFATDKTSGMAYFEIQEPSQVVKQFGPPYILSRQDPGAFWVKVTVVDFALNKRHQNIKVNIPYSPFIALARKMVFLAIILTCSLVALFTLWRLRGLFKRRSFGRVPHLPRK